MSEALKELIERLEKATGPDRELDADIFEAVTGSRGRTISPAYSPANIQERVQVSRGVPHYTASINAALTLLPDGLPDNTQIMLVIEANDRTNNVCQIDERGDYPGEETEIGAGTGQTAAISICIAALRAGRP